MKGVQLEGFASAAMALAMIASFLLIAGGIQLTRRGERQKGVLMLVAAAVLAANVLILTI